MTDPKLLPLHAAFEVAVLGYRTADAERVPEGEIRRRWNLVMNEARDYARACVAHATPAQSAEIEALRAEVRELKADRDSWEQQASDRVSDWHDEHKRSERLAEALRDCVDLIDTLTPLEGTTMRKARAALEQENGNG